MKQLSKKKKEFKPVVVGEVQASEFLRSRWKHYVRWIVFCIVLFLYFSLLLMSYRAHILQGKGFLPQELVVYILCSIMLLPILPSVVLEVDYVRVEDDGIVFQNLVYRKKEKWEDITKFTNPQYLKFAIVKTKKFVYLLNRRDMPNFDQLAQSIEEKKNKLRIVQDS